MSAIITEPYVASLASYTLVNPIPYVVLGPELSPDCGEPTGKVVTCGFQVGWSEAGALNSQPKFKDNFQVPNISI